MHRTRFTPALIPSLLLLAAGGLMAACEPPVLASDCQSNEDCPEGYLCDDEKSYCYVDPEGGDDGGLEADSGRVDGGALDRVALDRPQSDRRAPDANRRDTSTLSDSAELDASAADTLALDQLATDTWYPDHQAPDLARADSGLPDGHGRDLLRPDSPGPELSAMDRYAAQDAFSVDQLSVTDSGVSEGGVSEGGTSEGGTSESGTFEGGTFEGGTFEGGTTDSGNANLCPSEWWNTAWQYRRLVTLELTDADLDGLGEAFPVPIAFRVPSYTTDVAHISRNGLRVVEPFTQQALAYEVELWEADDPRRRIIWTKLPLDQTPPYLLCIYYTYDNTDPDPTGVIVPANVWELDAPYQAVWHFTSSPDVLAGFDNSVQLPWDLTPVQTSDGQIGFSAWSDSANTSISGESEPAESQELTVSFWLRVGTGTTGHVVGLTALEAAWDFDLASTGGASTVGLSFRRTYPDGTTDSITQDINRHQWVHVAVVRDASRLVFYVDEVEKAGPICAPGATDQVCPLPVGGALEIGDSDGADAFNFAIDELRIKPSAAPPRWIFGERAVTLNPFENSILGPEEGP